MRFMILLMVFSLTYCGFFKKRNIPTESTGLENLKERDALYCSLSKPIVEENGGTTDKDCDAALFTSLHALQCDYVDPGIFELENSGKLCRRPGCTCWERATPGASSSDSGFSKDMATGQQCYYSAFPDEALAKRVQSYGAAQSWTVCDAKDSVTILSKCVMSPKIIYRWAEIENKAVNQSRYPEEKALKVAPLVNTDFRAHLDIVGIITEFHLYKGISDNSLEIIKKQAEREPNNLLFQAMAATFITGDRKQVAKKLLEKFPEDRLPSTSDYCTEYLYQRDEYRGKEVNKDWLPCTGDKVHPGTDYLLASYVLQLEE